MKRICIIYPKSTAYVIPLLSGMSEYCLLDVIYSSSDSRDGFGTHIHMQSTNLHWIEVETIKPFGEKFGLYQKGVIKYLLNNHPDIVIIWANLRYASFWAVLIICKLLGIKVYPKGHGLVKKQHISLMQKWMYWIISKFSTKYICYTESVKKSLLQIIPDEDYLVVDNNTLYNSYPIQPAQKTGKELGIFFIGRLRPNCGIELLIEAIRQLRSNLGFNINLHVIGDGPLSKSVLVQLPDNTWIYYYGLLYDNQKISEISKQCRFGCYPMDAGLSVVHMMSLSLPPVTHNQLNKHMGPEPSYIKHKYNGWLYSPRGEVEPLLNAIKIIFDMPTCKIEEMQKAAYDTYCQLSTPPYHIRLLNIVGGID